MKRVRTARVGMRAAIAVVALYALVLSSLLGGLAGAAAMAAPEEAGFAICRADSSGPGDPGAGGDPPDCRTVCRLHGATTPLLPLPIAAAVPRPSPRLDLAVAPRTAPEPTIRRVAGPLGSRAPPHALSPSSTI